MATGKALTCDLFCTVVDNYGDIGVCWRLARQLAHEHGVAVRLWVDDLESFQRLCPQVEATLPQQICREVEVRRWSKPFPDVVPAALVIEAFACKLPENYVAAMAQQTPTPMWLNLEYLSAEDWVEGCHKLPSPHLRLPLVKYFFFPGFTPRTGGLLIERDLLTRRDAFQNDAQAQAEYWSALGVPQRRPDELRISLFSYENDAVQALLATWVQSAIPITCLVPEGRVLPQVAAFFGRELSAGDTAQRGALRVHALPFVEQEQYDLLLWACDVNFVRGEDSCVRAQWAGKPFVWHIYPQHDKVQLRHGAAEPTSAGATALHPLPQSAGFTITSDLASVVGSPSRMASSSISNVSGVHIQKLRALSALYGAGLPPQAAQANEALWLAWNGVGDIGAAWQSYLAQRSALEARAKAWARELSGNSLALNLLDFFRQVGKMRAFKN